MTKTNVLAVAIGSLLLAACTAEMPDDGAAPTVAVDSDGVDTAMINLPPTVCTAKNGCGAPVGTPIGPTAPVCASGNNQCFGAVGINCDGAVPNGLPVPQDGLVAQAGCFGGKCWINAGSWVHDQCCFGNATGRWCGGPLTALNTGSCVAEWDRAVHRVAHRLGWERSVDMCRVDGDGAVDFADYCAPGGTIVSSTDTNRCCSGGAHALGLFATDAVLVASQLPILDGSFTPMVCNGPRGSTTIPGSSSGGSTSGSTTPPPPKKCLTNAQCDSDERCLAPAGFPNAQKTCVAI